MSTYDPYADDDAIELPPGCTAEDVDIALDEYTTEGGVGVGVGGGGNGDEQEDAHTMHPRPLTYGLENGPLATQPIKPASTSSDSGATSIHESPSSFSGHTPGGGVGMRHRSASSSRRGPRSPFRVMWSACQRCCGIDPDRPDIEKRFGRKFSLGERVADRVSAAVGSWNFVIVQSLCLATWIVLNVLIGEDGGAPDPYPFILLNLLLSFQAAYTAPIIMMSQNRQSDIDRDKAFDLHEKVDHIRLNQVWALWDQMQLQQRKLDAIERTLTGVQQVSLFTAQVMQMQMQGIHPATAMGGMAGKTPDAEKATTTEAQPPTTAESPTEAAAPSATVSTSAGAAPTAPSTESTLAPPVDLPHLSESRSLSAPAVGHGPTSAHGVASASSVDGQMHMHGGPAAPSRSTSIGALPPAAGPSSIPCDCRPPNMCDRCCWALERAEVSPAFLQRANPRYVPTMATSASSFPTTSLVQPPPGSHYAMPLEYLPQGATMAAAAGKMSPQIRPTRTLPHAASQTSPAIHVRRLSLGSGHGQRAAQPGTTSPAHPAHAAVMASGSGSGSGSHPPSPSSLDKQNLLPPASAMTMPALELTPLATTTQQPQQAAQHRQLQHPSSTLSTAAPSSSSSSSFSSSAPADQPAPSTSSTAPTQATTSNAAIPRKSTASRSDRRDADKEKDPEASKESSSTH